MTEQEIFVKQHYPEATLHQTPRSCSVSTKPTGRHLEIIGQGCNPTYAWHNAAVHIKIYVTGEPMTWVNPDGRG